MVTSVSSARVSSLIPPTSASACRRNAPIAPGTVGMQRIASYRRRSRLKPITYSMCCQVATSDSRLPTLTLPATAPTVGSASGCTSLRIEAGLDALHAAAPRPPRGGGGRLPQPADRVGLEDGVAVDGDDDVVPGQGDAG